MAKNKEQKTSYFIVIKEKVDSEPDIIPVYNLFIYKPNVIQSLGREQMTTRVAS